MTTTKLQGLSLLTAAMLFSSFAASAAPNPRSTAEIDVQWIASDQVHIVSSKDISHVVIAFCDGTTTKIEMHGSTPVLTLSNLGKIFAVSVKSGTTRTDPASNPFGCMDGGGTS